jgi:hypothetical protein
MSLRAVGLVALVLSAPALAHPVSMPAEKRVFPYDAEVAKCGDAKVLERIQSRFALRESRDWKTDLTLGTIDHIRETGFRSNGRDFIPRRYCTARAQLSTGKRVTLSYSISEDGGISGWQGNALFGLVKFATPGSFHLEWCIQGLDRHRTYAPDCVMTRP